MASAATLGYQSLPQSPTFLTNNTSVSASSSSSSDNSQYWSSGGSASTSRHVSTSSYSESPTRKRRKTITQALGTNASGTTSDTARTSRPRSLRRKTAATAAMQAQHMSQGAATLPHHNIHERDHSVRGRRSPRRRRAHQHYQSQPTTAGQRIVESEPRRQSTVYNTGSAAAHLTASHSSHHQSMLGQPSHPQHILTAAPHANHLVHPSAPHQQQHTNPAAAAAMSAGPPHQPRPVLVDLSQFRQVPVSGSAAAAAAAGYPSAALCASASSAAHHSFYNLPAAATTGHLSQSAAVQSQNVCNSLHVPWAACVQPNRLPAQQMAASTSQQPTTHHTAMAPAAMMTFAPTGGHTGGQQGYSGSDNSHLPTHRRIHGGLVDVNEMSIADRMRTQQHLHQQHMATRQQQSVHASGLAPHPHIQHRNRPNHHIRACPALQVASAPQPATTGILPLPEHIHPHQRVALEPIPGNTAAAINPYARYMRTIPSRRYRHIAAPAGTAIPPQLHGAHHQHPGILLHLWAMIGQQQRAVGPFRVAELTEETGEVENYEALLNLAERLGEAKPRGLSRQDIAKLPLYKYSVEASRDSSKDQTSCVVCMCDFEPKQSLRVLPCSHEFHQGCVDKWLKSNRTCPICRSDAAEKPQAKTVTSCSA